MNITRTHTTRSIVRMVSLRIAAAEYSAHRPLPLGLSCNPAGCSVNPRVPNIGSVFQRLLVVAR